MKDSQFLSPFLTAGGIIVAFCKKYDGALIDREMMKAHAYT